MHSKRITNVLFKFYLRHQKSFNFPYSNSTKVWIGLCLPAKIFSYSYTSGKFLPAPSLNIEKIEQNRNHTLRFLLMQNVHIEPEISFVPDPPGMQGSSSCTSAFSV